MILEIVDRIVGVVTTDSKATTAVMLLVTVLVGVGAADIPGPPEFQLGDNTVEQEKLDYIQANYGDDTDGGNG